MINANGKFQNYNIISGPNPRDYWNHNLGLKKEAIPEQNSLPVQGNIGFLIKQETNKYAQCDANAPRLGGAINCTGAFIPDAYTNVDNCGSECKLKYPESYGIKDFGFSSANSMKDTNQHQVNDKNVRVGMVGQMDKDGGCYDGWVPRIANNAYGACEMKQDIAYSQVGNWNFLSQYSPLQTVKYTK